MDLMGLVAGALLQWALGIAFVVALPRRVPLLPQPGAVAWAIGTGAFAGAFVMTLGMRGVSFANVEFGPLSIGGPMLAVTAVLAWIGWRRERGDLRIASVAALRTFSGRHLAGAWRWLWYALVAWLALRFALLLVEVALRPLFPWDAWTQWATKARVWYELRTMAPFALPNDWFASGGATFVDAGPHYPATVPLLMVWACITLGRWDDALMNLPFWQLAVGFCFAVYGALRSQRFGTVGALVGAWIVATLPLANAHVALAGYADLPMGCYFALAALTALRWTSSRERGDGLLALLFTAALPMIKVPGIVWVLTLFPAAILLLAPRLGLKIVGILFVGCCVALFVLAKTNPTVLGYQLHLDFAPAWGSLGSSYFLLGNWHLLWYGVVAVAVLGRREILAPALAPLSVVIGASLIFLFVVFGFTNAREWVADQTTVNRATLHLAPLIAVWMLLVFHAWMHARSDGEAAAATASA